MSTRTKAWGYLRDIAPALQEMRLTKGGARRKRYEHSEAYKKKVRAGPRDWRTGAILKDAREAE